MFFIHGESVKCEVIIRRGHRFLTIIPQAIFAEYVAVQEIMVWVNHETLRYKVSSIA